MAKKSDTLEQIQRLAMQMHEQQIELVRSTAGRDFISLPRKSGKGRSLVAFELKDSARKVRFKLLEAGHDWDTADVEEALDYRHCKLDEQEPREVAIRVAEHGDCIYLDLADTEGRVVKMASTGYDVVHDSECPILFHRPPSMLPLPVPEKGGTLEGLRSVLGVREHTDWVLILGWLLSALKPRGSQMILGLFGPPSTGKSTLARHLVQLIDNRKVKTPKLQYAAKDAQIAAALRRVIAYDEVNNLPEDKLGMICGWATDGGTENKKNYTDTDVVSVDVCRPTILIGNTNALTEERLRGRAVPVCLPSIDPQHILTDTDIEEAFLAAWAQNLGAVCDAVVGGLRHVGAACPPELRGRMLDGIEFAERCMQSAGFEPGAFARAVLTARLMVADEVVEEWPVLGPLREVAATGFCGTTPALLAELTHRAGPEARSRDWPQTANMLTTKLKDFQPTLAGQNIDVNFHRNRHKRLVTVRLLSEAVNAAPPDPVTAKTNQQRALSLCTADPLLLVYAHYTDDTYRVFGPHAEKAANILGRSADPGPGITLTSSEWHAVVPQLCHNGICMLSRLPAA